MEQAASQSKNSKIRNSGQPIKLVRDLFLRTVLDKIMIEIIFIVSAFLCLLLNLKAAILVILASLTS